MESLSQNVNGNNPFEIFNYKNLGSVRTILDEKSEPWFCLNDVCNILAIASPWNVASRLDPKGLRSTETLTNGGTQKMVFIDMGNMCESIGRSRKPEAKMFMRWVYREVLPQLSTKGYYIMNTTNGGMIQALKGVVTCLEDHEKRLTNYEQTQINQQQMLSTHEEQINSQQKTIENVDRTIKVLETEGFYSVSGFAKFSNVPLTLELAKEIGIIATNLANDQCINIGCITHPIYGHINLYPFGIISEAFRMCSYNNN